MQNFRLLEAAGKTGKPIGLKRGISGTIDEWLNAAEYIIAVQGNQKSFLSNEAFGHMKQLQGILSILAQSQSSKN